MTIDDAIRFLLAARVQVGPDACLILSLSGSGIPDADVDSMHVVQDPPDSRYVEVRVRHPDLQDY